MSSHELLYLPASVVLVGLMGCGKSSVGRRLARHLGTAFSDLDDIIEAKEGKSVTELFAEKGEPYFRKLEIETMEELLKLPPHIIASGGGAFMQPAIRDLIQLHGLSVWIKAPFDVLLERVSRKNNRPLLEQGNKAEILQDLMDKRYPTYALADITVESLHHPHSGVVDDIVERLAEKRRVGRG